jgi:hypothetical protein
LRGKAAVGVTLTVLLLVAVTAACSVVPANAEAELQLTTDKSVYIVGEEVQVTVENVGDVYVEIGGWPCVMIYTSPDSEPVWPLIFATLLWGLAPGESETWVWNQYNEYTGTPAEPGMYMVNDTLGLGLSAEFEIVPVELTISVNTDIALVGQQVEFTLVLTNVGEIDVTVTFASSQAFDLYYRAGLGLYRWSDGKWFTLMVWEVTLQPAESFSETLTWDLYQYNRADGSFHPPKPGAYNVWGVCVGEPGAYTALATTIKLVFPGDVNLDYKVDLLDAACISAHWYPGPPVGPLGFDSSFDVNGDAAINIADLAVISAYWTGPPKGPQAP